LIELQKQQTREKYNKVVTASQRKEQREFPKRFIYFVVDGQDILDSADLLFSFVEVNTRLNEFIPQKTWDSRPAQRMDFYQKIDASKPSAAMQE
jgi:hypothetical protein